MLARGKRIDRAFRDLIDPNERLLESLDSISPASVEASTFHVPHHRPDSQSPDSHTPHIVEGQNRETTRVPFSGFRLLPGSFHTRSARERPRKDGIPSSDTRYAGYADGRMDGGFCV